MTARFRQFLFTLVAVLAVTAAAPGFAAEKTDAKADPSQPANEITGKVPRNFVPLPRIAVAVKDAENDVFRQLEVELWVYAPTPEAMSKINSTKTMVADDIKAQLRKQTVQTFLNPDDGPSVIKEAAKEAIEKLSGKEVPSDVLIKSMLVH